MRLIATQVAAGVTFIAGLALIVVGFVGADLRESKVIGKDENDIGLCRHFSRLGVSDTQR